MPKFTAQMRPHQYDRLRYRRRRPLGFGLVLIGCVVMLASPPWPLTTTHWMIAAGALIALCGGILAGTNHTEAIEQRIDRRYPRIPFGSDLDRTYLIPEHELGPRSVSTVRSRRQTGNPLPPGHGGRDPGHPYHEDGRPA